MNLTIEQVNALPMPTWVHLGVNHTAIEEAVPVLAAAVAAEVPDLTRWAQGIRTDGTADMAGDITLAVGENAAAFVQANKNAGASLTIAPGYIVPEPLVYRYDLSGEHNTVLDENLIIAGEGSSCTVVLVYRSVPGSGAFHGGVTRIAAGKNAVVNLLQVQLLDDDAIHWQDVGISTGENARVRVTQIEVGAKRAVAGCYARLHGAGSEQEITAFYFGDGSRSLDFNHVVQHVGRKTVSKIETGGALLEKSNKIYRGTIDFVQGTRDAKGSETEDTLLFSPEARNRSAPLILCGEENVNGQHAATIGRLDAGMLFYLNTRGISETQAKQMMTEAQLQTALAWITDSPIGQELRAAVLAHIAKRMGLA